MNSISFSSKLFNLYAREVTERFPLGESEDEAKSLDPILYLLWEIEKKIDAEKFEEAVAYIEELEKDPQLDPERDTVPLISYLFHEKKAFCFKRMGRLEEALIAENELIADAEKIMEAGIWDRSTLSEHLLQRATLKIALGKNEEVISDLKAFLEVEKIEQVERIALFKLFEKKLGVSLLSPENATEGSLESLILQEKYEEALEKITLRYATSYYEKAICYALAGRFEEARQCYEELRVKNRSEFDEFNTVYPLFESTLYYLEGNTEKAIAFSKNIDFEILDEKEYWPYILFFEHL